MKTNLWSSSAVNGFLLALITVIFTLVQAAFPMNGTAAAVVVFIVKLSATVGLLYYFMKSFGQSLEESYTYGQAFTYGFVVSVCSNIVIACYLWIHYTLIFPDLIEKSMKTVEQIYTQYNVDPSTIDKVVKYFPVISSVGPLILYTLLSLIIVAILANFAKKPESPFLAETEE